MVRAFHDIFNAFNLFSSFEASDDVADSHTYNGMIPFVYNQLTGLQFVKGLAIDQAVTHRFPTAAARVRTQARSSWICGGQSGTGQIFSVHFGFSCQFSFLPLILTHHLSSWADTIGQLLADVPSGLSVTPPQETEEKKKNPTFCQFNTLVQQAFAHCLFYFSYVYILLSRPL
jgi:hypothetical protein